MTRSQRRRKRRDSDASRSHIPGSPPGLIAVHPEEPPPVSQVIAYGPRQVLELGSLDLAQIQRVVADHTVTWINVEGLGDAGLIEELGRIFNLHRLALEDVVNLHQRAKVEEYEDTLFIVLRMINSDDRCFTEQVSIFVGPNFVLTFQEGVPGDCFGRLRERIRDAASRLRTTGTDYLAYALIDAIVDAYYPVIEKFADRLDSLEDAVLANPNRQTMDDLHAVKSDLLILRRAIWPQREAISHLMRESTPRITDGTRVYLRDCHDHVVQIVELVETYRELTADLRDLYMSSISNRINETMRVLTIMSTLFIPLTFIAGIYGMNFDPHSSPLNMPELRWYFGYPLCLVAMVLSALGMVGYFYRQGWLFQTQVRKEAGHG